MTRRNRFRICICLIWSSGPVQSVSEVLLVHSLCTCMYRPCPTNPTLSLDVPRSSRRMRATHESIRFPLAGQSGMFAFSSLGSLRRREPDDNCTWRPPDGAKSRSPSGWRRSTGWRRQRTDRRGVTGRWKRPQTRVSGKVQDYQRRRISRPGWILLLCCHCSQEQSSTDCIQRMRTSLIGLLAVSQRWIWWTSVKYRSKMHFYWYMSNHLC
jgi:hypothetical protein